LLEHRSQSKAGGGDEIDFCAARERGFVRQVCRGDCGHWRGTGTPDMREFARDEGVQANINGRASNYPMPSGFRGLIVGPDPVQDTVRGA
jgi:hypothetical protein